MGVYIPNMEMPKDGEAVVLVISNENGKTLAEVDKYCGAVYETIPIHAHGRLIDADALMKEMDKQENAMFEHGREFSFSFKSGGDVCTAWYNVEMMVEDAPTIIPAEPQEES